MPVRIVNSSPEVASQAEANKEGEGNFNLEQTEYLHYNKRKGARGPDKKNEGAECKVEEGI